MVANTNFQIIKRKTSFRNMVNIYAHIIFCQNRSNLSDVATEARFVLRRFYSGGVGGSLEPKCWKNLIKIQKSRFLKKIVFLYALFVRCSREFINIAPKVQKLGGGGEVS